MMNKNLKLLATGMVALTSAAFASSCGDSTNLAHIKFRDYYSQPYVMTGGASAMAMENAQREGSMGAPHSLSVNVSSSSENSSSTNSAPNVVTNSDLTSSLKALVVLH